MILWSTCSVCGHVVKGTRTFFAEPGLSTDTYEPHTCEELPELTTAKHITYKKAHDNVTEGNNGNKS